MAMIIFLISIRSSLNANHATVTLFRLWLFTGAMRRTAERAECDELRLVGFAHGEVTMRPRSISPATRMPGR